MIHGILIERQNAQDDDSSEHDSEDEVALEDDDAEGDDETQVHHKCLTCPHFAIFIRYIYAIVLIKI